MAELPIILCRYSGCCTRGDEAVLAGDRLIRVELSCREAILNGMTNFFLSCSGPSYSPCITLIRPSLFDT